VGLEFCDSNILENGNTCNRLLTDVSGNKDNEEDENGCWCCRDDDDDDDDDDGDEVDDIDWFVFVFVFVFVFNIVMAKKRYMTIGTKWQKNINQY